jgi:hypothetical protein
MRIRVVLYLITAIMACDEIASDRITLEPNDRLLDRTHG